MLNVICFLRVICCFIYHLSYFSLGGRVGFIFIVCQKAEWFMSYSMQWRAVCCEYQSGCLSVKLFFNVSIKKHNSCNSNQRPTTNIQQPTVDNRRLQLDQLLYGPDRISGAGSGPDLVSTCRPSCWGFCASINMSQYKWHAKLLWMNKFAAAYASE